MMKDFILFLREKNLSSGEILGVERFYPSLKGRISSGKILGVLTNRVIEWKWSSLFPNLAAEAPSHISLFKSPLSSRFFKG